MCPAAIWRQPGEYQDRFIDETVSKSHIKILEELLEITQNLDRVSNASIAALLVVGKTPFMGFNQTKTHPMQSRYRKNPLQMGFHAEVHAISRAVAALGEDEVKNSKTTLYITRGKFQHGPPESRFWIQGLARPCDGCSMAIDDFGINKVFYTLEVGYQGLKRI